MRSGSGSTRRLPPAARPGSAGLLRRLAAPAALAALIAGCGEITSFSISISTWGGSHVGITVTATGGLVEYDCAVGRIDEPIVVRNGRFDVRGVHWPGQGGPIGVDTTRAPRPARYQGSIVGSRMTLAVILTDSGESLGPFTLVRGASPNLLKCY